MVYKIEMHEILSSINLKEHKMPNFLENAEIFYYTLVAFSLPFVISHTQQQFMVGTVVNAMLVLAALNIRGYKILPIIILPSIAVFLAAALFGQETKFILYLMPFIWVGNSILILGIKYLHFRKKMNEIVAYIISSFLKASFLFLSSLILVFINLIPAQFLTIMGIMQLMTALAGCAVGALIQRFKRYRYFK
ncbi:MAG: hypothetical protein QXO21_03480 [Candidatus Anstonellales archaeon]